MRAQTGGHQRDYFWLLWPFKKLRTLKDKKVAFIINRGSGNVLKRASKARLKEYIEKNMPEFVVFEPSSAEESAKITKQLIAEKYDAVFACGGDGTVNTIASELIHTDTALGIIPFGSGNGFARYHQIPMHWKKALYVSKNYREHVCDTGVINGKCFVNVAGIGYSAHISKQFKQEKGRGVLGYARVLLKNLKFDNRLLKMESERGTYEGEVFSLEFANGTQWGSNVFLDKDNPMDDNTLVAVAFKKISFFQLPFLVIRVLLYLTKGSSYVHKLKGSSFKAEYADILPIHIDGDYAGKSKSQIVVESVPKSLKVWVPN